MYHSIFGTRYNKNWANIHIKEECIYQADKKINGYFFLRNDIGLENIKVSLIRTVVNSLR